MEAFSGYKMFLNVYNTVNFKPANLSFFSGGGGGGL